MYLMSRRSVSYTVTTERCDHGDWGAIPVDAEQEQLDVLLSELARIEGQQTKLRDAVTHSQAIVVHPRREVCTLLLQKGCERHLQTNSVHFST